ncbi:MAG TPA: DUF397 domain-containing protein [Pseudonocardiaceae bacterium]|nr:DUF397 domain-containing protein [Pseudonocardiaceae bacterium]
MRSPDLSCATWRKSSRSGNGGQDCVELAILPRVVGVRDSKNRSWHLEFRSDRWEGFLVGVKTGSYDQ